MEAFLFDSCHSHLFRLVFIVIRLWLMHLAHRTFGLTDYGHVQGTRWTFGLLEFRHIGRDNYLLIIRYVDLVAVKVQHTRNRINL